MRPNTRGGPVGGDPAALVDAGILGRESEFGFGALHRLLVRFLDRTRALPGRQREAIGTAFGVVDGPPPDRFLVGLAALTVLSDVAAGRRIRTLGRGTSPTRWRARMRPRRPCLWSARGERASVAITARRPRSGSVPPI